MTNADRIRKMNDNELMEFILRVSNGDLSALNIKYCEDNCPYKEQCEKECNCINPDINADLKWWLTQEIGQPKVTLKQFADMLDGTEYGKYPQFSNELIDIAKANKIIIISGYSDDLVEADGYITDEAGAWDGGIVYLKAIKDGGFTNDRQENTISINAKWCEEWAEDMEYKIPWTYDTSVQHETFNLMEGDEIFCKGIVFYGF